MPSQSHGHVCLLVALCLVALLCLAKIQYGNWGSTFLFTRYSTAGTSLNSIANDTLGFEKVFVINAPWRTDRKDSISLAASYSGISLDWIEGIDADEIKDSAYPPGKHRQINHGNLGSWRAHMNAMREIIEKNLTSALILEDDADWDFRIRSQLSDLSPAVRRLPGLVHDADMHAHKQPPSTEEQTPNPVELAKRSSIALPTLNRRSIPNAEPYGQDWDILWLGHCGAALPPPSPILPNRIMLLNDDTVAAPKHLKLANNSPLGNLGTLYPPHTRLIYRANTTSCTLAYAVTQTGARKILYQFGIRDFSQGYDFALSDYCNGKIRGMRSETMPMCMVVQPPLFAHFWGERGGSDIVSMGPTGRPAFGSQYVRRSVRGNLEGLVRGWEGVEDAWGDEDEK